MQRSLATVCRVAALTPVSHVTMTAPSGVGSLQVAAICARMPPVWVPHPAVATTNTASICFHVFILTPFAKNRSRQTACTPLRSPPPVRHEGRPTMERSRSKSTGLTR